MKKIKTVLIVLLMFVLAFAFTACGATPDTTDIGIDSDITVDNGESDNNGDGDKADSDDGDDGEIGDGDDDDDNKDDEQGKPSEEIGTDGLLFGEIGDYAYEVVGYIGTEKDVIVPATHNGLPVTCIGTCAFYFSEYVENVTLPEGLEKVESYSLIRSDRFIDFNVPSTVTAFEQYYSRQFTVPEEKWSDGGLYVDDCLICVKLDTYDDFEIKPTTRLVADGALIYPSSKAFDIPESVEYLGSSTGGRVALSSIGSNLKRIGAGYMSQNYNPVQVDILDNVLLSVPFSASDIVIGEDIRLIFDGLGSFNSSNIAVDERNAKYYCENNYIIERDTKRIVGGALGAEIPQSAKIIGIGSFTLPAEDGRITIPDNIEAIEGILMNGSSDIKLTIGSNLTILNGVTARQVQEIDFKGTVEQFCKIKVSLWMWVNSSTESSSIDNTELLKIGGETVTEINVPNGVENVGGLCGNGAVLGLNLSDTVKSIRAFGLGKNVRSIEFGSSLKYIGKQLGFSRDNEQVVELTYRGSIEDLCERVTYVCDLPYASKYISYTLNIGGERVTDLVIPDGVTQIGAGAFSGIKFDSVTIPSSVVKIGKNAFALCELSSAHFADTDGWYRVAHTAQSTETEPVTVDLSDASAAATFLSRFGTEITGISIRFYYCDELVKL